MEYRFIVDYTPTDAAGEVRSRECLPIYGDDLAVTVEMEGDEWYRKRKLEGRLTFVRGDYEWVMSCAFDGTYRLTIESSTDGGESWQSYLVGTFSRANLEIDEDGKRCVLNGLDEGGEYTVIEEGKSEEYDLMKVMPDSEAREVQGEVWPALAMVDYSSEDISKSDVYCGGASTMAGYKEGKNDWSVMKYVGSDAFWLLVGVYAEANVVMTAGNATEVQGRYCGVLRYQPQSYNGQTVFSVNGYLMNENGCWLSIGVAASSANEIFADMSIYGSDTIFVLSSMCVLGDNTTGFYNPTSLLFESFGNEPFEKVEVYFHYIRATLLTQTGGVADNVLNTGAYYKRMAAFNNVGGGLQVVITTNTVEQPNGHRLVPGTGESGEVPQYFAPPEGAGSWIPLNEDGWVYASMWYTIEPTVENGLTDRSKVGAFRWTRCWTLGACIDRLLKKISGNKVSFEQSEAGSRFLYAAVNPLTQGEQFEYLFTQKSNVMRPSVGGASAARCVVRLEWFLEFLRNALNCYWWLEERNDGTYAFRVEHVEWFRRGGRYEESVDDATVINLAEIKTRRNFERNGEAAKRLDDGLHKYSYDMTGMTEKYTFSWQGEGGSDAFKGNPMFFKAGWVERGSSESHEVDNIFADLSWLMLNAGTDTASSKNYDGLFVFGGYNAYFPNDWVENSAPQGQYLVLSEIQQAGEVWCVMFVTAPEGYVMSVSDWAMTRTVTGTGSVQRIEIGRMIGLVTFDFGANYEDVTIHRIHTLSGNIYRVPNMVNRLGSGYLQNGALAWPWLQNEYLHYDIPAPLWSYDSDDLGEATFETTGTVKMRKKQEVPLLPVPTWAAEVALENGVIGGLRDGQGRLQTGVVKSATVGLVTRNAVLELMYDMIS